MVSSGRRDWLLVDDQWFHQAEGTRLLVDERNVIPDRPETFPSSAMSRPALTLNQPLFQPLSGSYVPKSKEKTF
jgi:hypothetical protein